MVVCSEARPSPHHQSTYGSPDVLHLVFSTMYSSVFFLTVTFMQISEDKLFYFFFLPFEIRELICGYKSLEFVGFLNPFKSW